MVNAFNSAQCEKGGGCDGYEQLRPNILLSLSCHGSASGRRINASSPTFISADCVFCFGAAKALKGTFCHVGRCATHFEEFRRAANSASSLVIVWAVRSSSPGRFIRTRA